MIEIGSGCKKENTNIYFVARKKAAEYDETLYSRDGASEKLGVSISTLADYELGNTKVVPVDKVVLMADLYKNPELKNLYCKNECPIGSCRTIATHTDSAEKIALDVIRAFDNESIKKIIDDALAISADGRINTEDKELIEEMTQVMNSIELVASELKLIAEKLGVNENECCRNDGSAKERIWNNKLRRV